MAKRSVFVREATGLVRTFSAWDALAINVGNLGIWTLVIFAASTAPIIGGDPITGIVIPFVGWFFIGLAFAITTMMVPRTAGDYVFTTRFLNPAAGFVGNAGVFLAVVPIGGIGIAIIFINLFALSPLLGYWGYVFNNPGLVSLASSLETNSLYEFAVGGILAVIWGLVSVFGGRFFKAMNRVMFPFLLFTIALTLLVLALTPQATALNSLNTITGNPNFVQNLMSWGASNNNPPASTSDFWNTINLGAVYASSFSFMIMATYFAGEIRRINRSIPIAMIGTLVVMAVSALLAIVVSYNTFGYNFLSNLYVQSITNGSPPLPILPYLDFLAAAISPNVIIGTLIILGPLLQTCWLFANGVFVGSRLLFSYSMDRIVPAFLADVNDKFHVPTKAIITTLILGLLGGMFFALPSASSAFLLSGAAIAILYIFPVATLGVAMLVYRLKRPNDFKASAIAKTPYGGALYYIAALVTLGYGIIGCYQYVTIPVLLGYAGVLGVEFVVVPVIILFALFYASKFINSRHGVKFDLIFKEIPPE